MFSFIGGLFGGLPSILQWGIIASIFFTGAYYVREYDLRGREVTTLTLKLSAANDAIRVGEANVRLADNALVTIGKAYDARNTDIEASCKLLTAIAASKEPGADDPVHKLIADTIKHLGPQ